MPKYRTNHIVTRQMLTEPNCGKVIKQIRSILGSRWFDHLTLEEKQQLLIYLQEIERRNKTVDWNRLDQINDFVKNLYRTYNK